MSKTVVFRKFIVNDKRKKQWVVTAATIKNGDGYDCGFSFKCHKDRFNRKLGNTIALSRANSDTVFYHFVQSGDIVTINAPPVPPCEEDTLFTFKYSDVEPFIQQTLKYLIPFEAKRIGIHLQGDLIIQSWKDYHKNGKTIH